MVMTPTNQKLKQSFKECFTTAEPIRDSNGKRWKFAEESCGAAKWKTLAGFIDNPKTSETWLAAGRGDRSVIFVLESPHTDEFDGSGSPIGPAQGATGRNLVESLLEKLGNAGLNQEKLLEYSFVLMNAVEFQCSGGVLGNYRMRRRRDQVFREFWGAVGRKDFMNRLDALCLTSEDILINACTLGVTASKGRPALKALVDRAIREVI
jgi:hypothetical protein